MRLLAFVVVLAGCTVDGTGHDGNLDQGDTDDKLEGSASGQVTSGASTVATTSGAGGSPTGATTSTVASGAGGADADVCTPEMDDSPCIDCLKQQCCSEIEACVQDGACACWADCLQDGDFTDCGICGVPNDLLDQLLICAEGCQLECGA